jgi:hypothetical protein
MQAFETRHMISCSQKSPPPLDDQEIVCIMRFAAARALSLVMPAQAAHVSNSRDLFELLITHAFDFSYLNALFSTNCKPLCSMITGK